MPDAHGEEEEHQAGQGPGHEVPKHTPARESRQTARPKGGTQEGQETGTRIRQAGTQGKSGRKEARGTTEESGPAGRGEEAGGPGPSCTRPFRQGSLARPSGPGE